MYRKTKKRKQKSKEQDLLWETTYKKMYMY